ncbi:MAG TPA: SDR family NAD(P)-dependent oxidoreductase [Gammaproteobacteria bacterium]
MKVAFLGATRGMGRSLARLMGARGERLFLIGRDEEQLSRSASDLDIRGAGSVGTATCDLLDPLSFAPALEAADAALDGFDVMVVTAGAFAPQDELEADGDRTRELLTVNFVSTVILCEEARRRLLARGGGTICVFSSVAGDRARKPVILYGASKAGLSHYLTGLDHKFRVLGLRTVLVKPGFVHTGMTEGLEPPPFAGDPDDVARTVLRAIDRGKPVVYAPAIWKIVMLAIRMLPRAVMRRIEF